MGSDPEPRPGTVQVPSEPGRREESLDDPEPGPTSRRWQEARPDAPCHVPDPASVVAACATLVKPGGQVFFSTINRNPKSYLFAIVGAEYVLNMLPKGTHDYAKFIRPSELAHWTRDAGLATRDITGLTYNPLTGVYKLDPQDVDVNYLVATLRTE